MLVCRELVLLDLTLAHPNAAQDDFRLGRDALRKSSDKHTARHFGIISACRQADNEGGSRMLEYVKTGLPVQASCSLSLDHQHGSLLTSSDTAKKPGVILVLPHCMPDGSM